MTRMLSSLVLAAALTSVAAGAASARDADDDHRPSYGHIRKDEAKTDADLRKVRAEQRDVAEARRNAYQSWWFGNTWGSHHAAEKVREERNELSDARAKLYRDQLDLYRDRARRYETD